MMIIYGLIISQVVSHLTEMNNNGYKFPKNIPKTINRADASYDLVELYDYNTANEDMNDSPFRYSASTCEYYETEEFSDITGNFNDHTTNVCTVQITFIFIGQTHLVFGNHVCTCVTKHSNAFRTFLNWLKNLKRVLHEPKLHISRLPLFANFDL